MIRRAVVGDPETGGRAGGVAAVAVAVERISIRHRDAGRIVGVVGVTDQVDAALDLRRIRSEQRRIGRQRARRRRRRERRHGTGATKIGVRVIDAGVDDRDLDVLAAQVLGTLPDGGRADVRHAHGVIDLVRHYGHDADDAWQTRKPRQLAALDVDLDAVHRVGVMREYLAPAAGNRRLDAGVLRADSRVNVGMILRADRVINGGCTGLGDRGVAHDDHDLDPFLGEQRQRQPRALQWHAVA